MWVTVLAAASGVLLAGSVLAGERQVIRVHQEPPKQEYVDLGAKGPSHGDLMFFDARFAGEKSISGMLHGMLVTISLGDAHEHRFGQLYFDFGGEDSIVVTGRRFFVRNEQYIPANKEQAYAVIGGTGRFVGARGQVLTTRNNDGSFDHTIMLLP